MRFFFLFFLIALFFSSCKNDFRTTAKNATTSQVLLKKWEMRQADSDDWMPVATIPSTVHTALLANKRIEEPFYADNFLKQDWIATKDWEYRKRFDVQPELLQEEVVELLFKGLDTYADVYLNGQKILKADNMFRSWLVDVKSLLKEKDNELRLFFHSPTKMEKQKAKSLGYTLPTIQHFKGKATTRAFSRKAAFHYGSEVSPPIISMGPWRGVELQAWSRAVINEVHYRTFPEDDKALVQAFFDIQSNEKAVALIQVEIAGQSFEKEIRLEKGQNQDSLSFTLVNPKLWWPNELGEQNLYEVKANLLGRDFSDLKEDRIGIREIRLKQPGTSDGVGFVFSVNGVDFYSKGANYLPQDMFQDRVSEAQYRKLLTAAKDAHMNMLRVWGGGIYEEDIFYALCDELGLLVWQDFMFAGAMVPGDEAFRQNVAIEASQQVSRLANHPCIALWCGNDEIAQTWRSWTKEELTEEVRTKLWADYKAIFKNILPKAVEKVNPFMRYWETSPQYGQEGTNHLYVGDAHHKDIGADEPIENYATIVPRFMSAYGFPSMANAQSIAQFSEEQDWQ
ncbi:MAG TPA: glycoside hydrolase family 2 protein, partial [Phaeodactylibacter sp.]|nr:glycoside hydrolase family 2 protein [Phaeodactylibacter sp.]